MQKAHFWRGRKRPELLVGRSIAGNKPGCFQQTSTGQAPEEAEAGLEWLSDLGSARAEFLAQRIAAQGQPAAVEVAVEGAVSSGGRPAAAGVPIFLDH